VRKYFARAELPGVAKSGIGDGTGAGLGLGAAFRSDAGAADAVVEPGCFTIMALMGVLGTTPGDLGV
jgi:hypothetical protein